MRPARFLGDLATVAALAVITAAFRRAEETGCTVGAGLCQVLGEWAPSAVRERLRSAAHDGARAMAVRERVARLQMAAAGAVAR